MLASAEARDCRKQVRAREERNALRRAGVQAGTSSSFARSSQHLCIQMMGTGSVASANLSKDEFLRKCGSKYREKRKSARQPCKPSRRKRCRKKCPICSCMRSLLLTGKRAHAKAWKKWQRGEIWAHFKSVMCRRLKKNIDDLVVSRAEILRGTTPYRQRRPCIKSTDQTTG